ncbi:hypothetical protein AAVH_11385 [Aphelenchoides avenae]|nr:hypothetical protein AAVH_11385 [Aphelenchus avenae]
MAPDNNDSGSSTPSVSETRTLFSRSVANPQLVKLVPHNFTPAEVPSAQTANDGDFRESTFYHARRQRPNSGTQDVAAQKHGKTCDQDEDAKDNVYESGRVYSHRQFQRRH